MAKKNLMTTVRLPRASIIGGNIGGIGKSSYLTVMTDTYGLAAQPFDLLQLDEQSKLERMTGQPVISLDVAVFQKSREDDWAPHRALGPAYHALLAMPETRRSVGMEIAGGMSGVAHDAFGLIDIAEEMEELNLSVDAHIVVVASEESLRQVPLEVERHRQTFPGGLIVLVFNNRYGSVEKFLRDVPDDLSRPVLALMAEVPVIRMRRVHPDTMKRWEKLAVLPSTIARWRVEGGYALVSAKAGLDRLEAKLFAGEIVGWAAEIREQLIALIPELGGVGE